MSQPRTISKPPPSATPLTRAITGTSSVSRSAMPPKPPGRGAAQYSRPVLFPEFFMSAPAQNARSPAPVSTTVTDAAVGFDGDPRCGCVPLLGLEKSTTFIRGRAVEASPARPCRLTSTETLLIAMSTPSSLQRRPGWQRGLCRQAPPTGLFTSKRARLGQHFFRMLPQAAAVCRRIRDQEHIDHPDQRLSRRGRIDLLDRRDRRAPISLCSVCLRSASASRQVLHRRAGGGPALPARASQCAVVFVFVPLAEHQFGFFFFEFARSQRRVAQVAPGVRRSPARRRDVAQRICLERTDDGPPRRPDVSNTPVSGHAGPVDISRYGPFMGSSPIPASATASIEFVQRHD